MVAALPRRGDFVRLNFDPVRGREQAGYRPGLVLSNSGYNANASTILICPVTSKGRSWPFQVPIPAGMRVRGFILADQVRAVDWRERTLRVLGPCPPVVFEQVRALVEALISGGTVAGAV